MKKTLKTLAKELDFNEPLEYYEYLYTSWANGNPTQCKELFNAMKKEDQKSFFAWLKTEFANFADCETAYNFYFKLL